MPYRHKINETEEGKPLDQHPDYETIEYHLVYAELIKVARHRGTITSQELAALLGLPPKDDHTKERLGNLLELISWNEVNHDRPMLGAVAVTKRSDLGERFYTLARELGELATEGRQDAADFREEELQRIYKTWQQKFQK